MLKLTCILNLERSICVQYMTRYSKTEPLHPQKQSRKHIFSMPACMACAIKSWTVVDGSGGTSLKIRSTSSALKSTAGFALWFTTAFTLPINAVPTTRKVTGAALCEAPTVLWLLQTPPASPKPPKMALPSCSTATLGGTINVTLPQKAVLRMVMTSTTKPSYFWMRGWLEWLRILKA